MRHFQSLTSTCIVNHGTASIHFCELLTHSELYHIYFAMSAKFEIKSLEAIETSYATASAGMHPSHTLPLKLRAIADAGFKWTEIAFPDLEQCASAMVKDYTKIDDAGAGDVETLVKAAETIHDLCKELGLRVLTVMPYVLYTTVSRILNPSRLVGSPSSRDTKKKRSERED